MARTHTQRAPEQLVELKQRDRSLSERMSRAQKGDSAAYQELLFELKPMIESHIKRTLRRWGKLEAVRTEDLLQETLMAIHAKRHTYDPNHPFGPWVYAIARHKVIDELRRRRVEIELSEENLIEDNGLSQTEIQLDLLASLAHLSGRDRSLVEDVKIRQMPLREVSQKHGITESAVKVAVHRAVRKVQAILVRE